MRLPVAESEGLLLDDAEPVGRDERDAVALVLVDTECEALGQAEKVAVAIPEGDGALPVGRAERVGIELGEDVGSSLGVTEALPLKDAAAVVLLLASADADADVDNKAEREADAVTVGLCPSVAVICGLEERGADGDGLAEALLDSVQLTSALVVADCAAVPDCEASEALGHAELDFEASALSDGALPVDSIERDGDELGEDVGSSLAVIEALPLKDETAVALLLASALADASADREAVVMGGADSLSLDASVTVTRGLDDGSGDGEGLSDALSVTDSHALALALAERVAVPVRDAERDVAADALIEPVAHALADSLDDADADRLAAGVRDCGAERVAVAR